MIACEVNGNLHGQPLISLKIQSQRRRRHISQVQRYRLKRETPFSEFQLQIAGEWGVPVELQRWWLWTNRGNGTLRPSRPVTQDEYANMVADIKPSSSNVTHPHRNPHQHGLRLYLGEHTCDPPLLKGMYQLGSFHSLRVMDLECPSGNCLRCECRHSIPNLGTLSYAILY